VNLLPLLQQQPSPPSALQLPQLISSATAASGGGSITVNFTQAASSTNPVTSITVTRNGSAYTTLTPSSTSFTDATVANGSSYTYTLTANNALYSSSATSTAALTPTAAPAAPSFTTTTPGSNQVSLAWSAVASTSANPVTGYRLYVSLNSGAYTLLATQASTSYTDSSALNGNSYSYRVEAYGSGGTSAQATSTTVTPSGLPTSAPTITSTPTSISATTLNWSAVTSTSANPVTGYTLQRSTTSSSGPWTTIYTGSLLSYNATGLSTGNSYYYRVAATNATGSGNYSSSAFYTPGATPVIYSVTPGNASATLTFSGMTIAQGEYLQSVALLACSDQAMSANCVNTYIDIQPMASYTVYYLNNGTPYYFKSIYTTTLRTVSSAVVGSFTPNAPPAYPPAFTYTNPTNSSNQTLFNFPAAITSIAAPVTTTGIQFCQDQVMTSGCVSYNFSNSTTSLLVNLSTNFPTGSMLQGRLFATNWMGTTYGYPENITAYNPAPTALAPTVTSATSYYINLSWPQVPSTQAAPVTNLYVQYCADAAMTTSCNTTSWINPPVTSTTIWYLSANTTYYFRIEVVGASTTYGPVTRGSTTP